MLTETMKYFGLAKDFQQAGNYETGGYRQMMLELKAAIKQGKLIALSGVVGSGKTLTLQRLEEELTQEREIVIAKSLSVEKDKVGLGTLIAALYYDLSSDKKIKVPPRTEQRERVLQDLMRRKHKPVVLLVDEAHDLHGQTLTGLKRLMEIARAGKATLSIVLAGHPKLKNDLRRPAMEEIGSRTLILDHVGIQEDKQKYVEWLFKQCAGPKTKLGEVITEEAVTFLTTRLSTPLQFEQYLTLALEEAYQLGQKPVDTDVVHAVMAMGIDDLEPSLKRQGYGLRDVCRILNIRQQEARALFRGDLPSARRMELQGQLVNHGIAF